MSIKKESGWISVYRSIRNHWIFPKGRSLSDFEAWILILLEVNHSEVKVRIGNRLLICRRGESLNSLDTWSRLFHWNKSKVRRYFKLLESDTMIKTNNVYKTTHLTVLNYDSYQQSRHDGDTQMTRKRHDGDTMATPNNNDNKENNVNKDINKRKQAFGSQINEIILTDREKYKNNKQDLREFFEYWTEHGINDKKMRFEKEKSFGIARRLDTWFKNKEKFNGSSKKEPTAITQKDKELYESDDPDRLKF